MTVTDSTRAFQAMVKKYESSGWEVRTIDNTGLRATVRAITRPAGGDTGGQPVQVAAVTGCRRLWVDSKGEIQETTVPC